MKQKVGATKEYVMSLLNAKINTLKLIFKDLFINKSVNLMMEDLFGIVLMILMMKCKFLEMVRSLVQVIQDINVNLQQYKLIHVTSQKKITLVITLIQKLIIKRKTSNVLVTKKSNNGEKENTLNWSLSENNQILIPIIKISTYKIIK